MVLGAAQVSAAKARTAVSEASLTGSNKDSAKFAKDSHEEEDEGTHIARRPRGVTCERDDARVLGEGREWWDSGETGDGGRNSVGEHATLNALHKRFARDFQVRHVGRGGDIADCLADHDGPGCDHGENKLASDRETPCTEPQERANRSRGDDGAVEVAGCSRDDETDDQAHENRGRLHERRAEYLAKGISACGIFRRWVPHRSTMTMNEEKPRPRYEPEPQYCGFGPEHLMVWSVVQLPEPPLSCVSAGYAMVVW
jgi:hypothetical protein